MPIPESPRIAIVTGAGSGIGRAIALRLVSDGWRCMLVARREDALLATAAAAGGDQVLVHACDIGDAAQRDRLISVCRQRFGGLTALVNNAGVSRLKPLLDQDVRDWQEIVRTNLEAPFFLSQRAIPAMRDAGWGRIVNIGSIYGSIALNNDWYGDRAPALTAGHRGPIRESPYAASKGGLLQLTRELAAAVGRWQITVNTVSPGPVALDHRAVSHDVRERLNRMTPLGRVGRPEDIAAAVSFIVSPDAAFITGVNLLVDGGWSIW